MNTKPWCSLRSKIVLALLTSSVLVTSLVAWRVETNLVSHFDQVRVQCSWRRLEGYLQDAYRQYGSWTEALASPDFPALTPNYCLPPSWQPPEGETASFVLTDTEGVVLAPDVGLAETRSAGWLREAFEVKIADEVVGYVRLQGELLPAGPVQETLNVLRRSFAYGFGVAILFLALAGYFIADQMVKPLRRLNRATERMAKGAFEQVAVTTRDEVGELTESFNRMSRDLSQAYRDLEQAKSDAEAANHAKSTFLANMNHELRTPLNAIIGFAQLLNRETLTEEQLESVAIIRNSGEYLLQLINNVLSLVQFETGNFSSQVQAFDVQAFATEVRSMFAPTAQRKGLHFSVEVAADTPQHLVSDDTILRAVLINLIGNALKFTSRGQVKVVLAYQTDTKHIDGSGRLQVQVHDTGVGIAEEEHAKVFAAFEQTRSGQQSREGTGLGLHLSQRLVRQLGGEMTFSSQQGQGSTFAFSIPVEVGFMPVTASYERVIGFEADITPKVLIVDDHAENRQWLAALLTQIGFQVDTATDGEQALTQWSTVAPDFIWMDVRLPGQDGFDIAKRIKDTPQGQNVPIVALTASEEATYDPRGQVFNAILRKPVLETDVLATLAHYLPVHYRYETASSEHTDKCIEANTDVFDVSDMSSSDLCDLPETWRVAFLTACQEASVSALHGLIDELPAHSSDTASVLRRFVNDFAYDTLEELFTPVPQQQTSFEQSISR